MMDYGQKANSSNAQYVRACLIDHDYDLDSFFAAMKRNKTAPPSSEDEEEDESDLGSVGEDQEQKQKCKFHSKYF